MNIKLIAMDMDGTLLKSNNKISDKTKEILLRVQEKGIRLALASGRSYCKLMEYAKELQMDVYGGYLIEVNGMAIYDVKEQKRHIRKRMPREDAQQIFRYFQQFKVEIIGHLDDGMYDYNPKEILEEVADIRVLALDKSSKNIKKKIEKYCNENEKIANKTMKSYEKYFETIQDKLPQKILEDYEFHDCEIISIDKVKDDIVFTLDNSGGFTDISKIIYRNGEILENNLEENSYWVYDEIYILDDGYEFHIGISSGEEYDYITLRCSDVDFE